MIKNKVAIMIAGIGMVFAVAFAPSFVSAAQTPGGGGGGAAVPEGDAAKKM